MPSLAETQARLRAAVAEGDARAVAPLLRGGPDPLDRLAVHRCHYQTSLAEALLQKFPAATWLAGVAVISAAGRDFIRQFPPHAPCMAEYAEAFPDFLASHPASAQDSRVSWLAALDWRVGQAAIAIELPPLGHSEFAAIPVDSLCDIALRCQPGLRYLDAPYPVDALIEIFLRDEPPPQTLAQREEALIEIRGARGEFTIGRLDRPTFTFRQALAAGRQLGEAADAALVVDPRFDVGGALAILIAEGLAVAMDMETADDHA